MRRAVGRGVSPGLAVGRALVALRDAQQVRYRLASSGVDRERQRLRGARDRTRRDLEEISARVSRTLGPAQAAIFAAQLLMLDDPLLVRRADELIRTERLNADWAVERATDELRELFAREGDAWLKERVGDVADVGGRLMRNLRPARDPLTSSVHELEGPLILVADDVPPSVAAQLDWTRVIGLICDAGSPTHHTVILLRSLGVPVVIGLGGATSLVAPGQTVAIDGRTGEVAVEPPPALLEAWRERSEAALATERGRHTMRDRPALTADGQRITLEANLEIADEVHRVLEAGAEGIGLYRSEFLLDAPGPEAAGEDAQVAVYRALLTAMHPRPVTIRTFDAAEDRATHGRPGAHRDRFGLRGIRGRLHHDERFLRQVRALVRSADAGALRILLPFVTSTREVRAAREVITDTARSCGVTAAIPVGAMIEVPAAAVTVDLLARVCDFLSVGTNDLVQYTLAVDRTDDLEAGEFPPASPAVLRLLRGTVVAARRAGCPLSICGEMAADPALVGLLVGLGFRAFSMSPQAIGGVKQGLGRIDTRDAASLARRALRAETPEEISDVMAPLADAIRAAMLS